MRAATNLAVIAASFVAMAGCPLEPLAPPLVGDGGAAGHSAGGGGESNTGGAAGDGGDALGGGGSGGTLVGGGGGAPIEANAYHGGLVWDDWTTSFAGGSALPAGVDAAHRDFVRCAACHGWDALGDNGGYVRRAANELRPEPTTGADLSWQFGSIIEPKVEHPWGRAWDVLDNNMPDYSQPGSLTPQQMADVVAYLNAGPKIGDIATLDIVADPVAYTFVGANTTAGEGLYADRCAACHNADGTAVSSAEIGPYFSADGGYSEGFHKIVFGVSPLMTRSASGNLTDAEARDILAYIQANLGTVFPTN